jgi:hypothetical protein
LTAFGADLEMLTPEQVAKAEPVSWYAALNWVVVAPLPANATAVMLRAAETATKPIMRFMVPFR